MIDIKLNPANQSYTKNQKSQIQNQKPNAAKQDSFIKKHKKEVIVGGILASIVASFGMGYLAYKGNFGKKAQEIVAGFVNRIKSKAPTNTKTDDVKPPKNATEPDLTKKKPPENGAVKDFKIEDTKEKDIKINPEAELIEQKPTAAIENTEMPKEINDIENAIELELSKEDIPVVELADVKAMPEVSADSIVEIEPIKKEDVLTLETDKIDTMPEMSADSIIELSPIKKEKSTVNLAEIMKDVNIIRL